MRSRSCPHNGFARRDNCVLSRYVRAQGCCLRNICCVRVHRSIFDLIVWIFISKDRSHFDNSNRPHDPMSGDGHWSLAQSHVIYPRVPVVDALNRNNAVPRFRSPTVSLARTTSNHSPLPSGTSAPPRRTHTIATHDILAFSLTLHVTPFHLRPSSRMTYIIPCTFSSSISYAPPPPRCESRVSRAF